MLEQLLELSHRDNSNKWSSKGFGLEICKQIKSGDTTFLKQLQSWLYSDCLLTVMKGATQSKVDWSWSYASYLDL